MKIPIKKLLIAIGAAGAISAANAQTTTNLIFASDFDSTGINDDFSYGYGYAYAGSDSGAASTSFTGGAITPGVGLTNSSGFAGYPDYSALATDPNYIGSHAYTYAGTALRLFFNAPLHPLAPAADFSNIRVSFDAIVAGLLPSQASTTVAFGPASTDGFLELTTVGVTTFKFQGTGITVNSNYTHIDIPLSALSLIQGNANDLTNPAVMGAIDGFDVDLRALDQVGNIGVDRSPVFGFDANNSVVVDNFSLRQTIGTPPPLPKIEKVITDIDFDGKQAGMTYGFVFRDGADSATVAVTTNATGGLGGSAGLQGTADLSSWSATPPTGFSGFGAGAGSAPAYTLTSSDKASYRIYCTVKVAGLLPGLDSIGGNVSIQFLVPPGTLTPSNPAPAVVLELFPSCTFSNVFESFVFEGSACPIGIYSGGSQALFNQYVQQVNLVQVQAQANGNPDLGTMFNYDNDNTMVLDNIKVVELVTGIPPVSIVKTNSQVKVYWADPIMNGTAKLQSATKAAGPYLDVAGAASGAASPYTTSVGNTQTFFRAKWVP